MASLGISMQFFQKRYVTSTSGMLFLLFVQSLLKFGAKEGKCEGYYGEKIILKCPFSPKVVWKVLLSFAALLKSPPYKVSLLICGRYITNNREIYRLV